MSRSTGHTYGDLSPFEQVVPAAASDWSVELASVVRLPT
jgi:hypothetical protein